MKLYMYRGIDSENVPEDVTHVIVDDSVTVIKKKAFEGCYRLTSVIMGDYVKIIEKYAFYYCHALQFIRLSKTLNYIGRDAFSNCKSLEALFLPSTVKSIERFALYGCESLRLMILPHDIGLDYIGDMIIPGTEIRQIAETAGLEYEHDDWGYITDESKRQINEWLLHHMDEAPFHRLCYNSSVTTKQINDYLTQNGCDSALEIDTIHGMTPLHMLAMNPYAPANAIAALLSSNMKAIFCVDNKQKTPLEYAREYNVGGLVAMINSLCNHRFSSIK